MRRGVRGKVTLPRVKRIAKPSGLVIHYHRALGGKLTRLPGDPETCPEAHAAWLAAEDTAPKEPPRRRQPRDLGSLCASYLASPTFRALAQVTREQRGYAIRKILSTPGVETVPVAGLAPRHVEAALDGLTPQMARNRLKVWRALAAHAVALGWRSTDFSVGVERAKVRERPHTAAAPDAVAALRARWPLGTQQRVAVELLYHHAPRRADLVALGRQHVKNGMIAWRQSKTRTWTEPMPLAPEAKAAIDALLAERPGLLTFLETRQGAARSAKAADAWWRKLVEAAGVSGLTMHGMRHTMGRDLAHGGAGDAAINLALGHTPTSAKAATYRQQVEAERIAKVVQETLSRTRGGNRGQG